jgi:hypothetical protein
MNLWNLISIWLDNICHMYKKNVILFILQKKFATKQGLGFAVFWYLTPKIIKHAVIYMAWLPDDLVASISKYGLLCLSVTAGISEGIRDTFLVLLALPSSDGTDDRLTGQRKKMRWDIIMLIVAYTTKWLKYY